MQTRTRSTKYAATTAAAVYTYSRQALVDAYTNGTGSAAVQMAGYYANQYALRSDAAQAVSRQMDNDPDPVLADALAVLRAR